MNQLKKVFLALSCLLISLTAVRAQNLFSGGDGSQDNPYKISTAEDLRSLSELVNNGENVFEGEYLLQTADITIPEDNPIAPIGGSSVDFSYPLGLSFQGHYDGGMHKIYNLNIGEVRNVREDAFQTFYVGLFGFLGNGATVSNLVIASGEIYGCYGVGAVAGIVADDASISRCKIGPDVRVYALSVAGGVIGTTKGNGMSITECANYANVSAEGFGLHKTAGGIVGATGNGRIEGCANFGDVWAKGGFAGGIVGSYFLSKEGFVFFYPEIKSCMNAGDITGQGSGAGGIIGADPFNISDAPKPYRQISNSYSYGQAWVLENSSFGPVVGIYLQAYPISGEKTYYDADRFFAKERPNDADSQIAFGVGEPKSHEEVLSEAFVATLNDGGAYLFEKDLHGFNKTMPVLKWINDTYDPEIDKPNQYRTDIPYMMGKRRAGSFFPPNRTADFLIYNMSMHEQNAQAKAIGFNNDRAWIDRVLREPNGNYYTYFASSSAFRRTLDEQGMYISPRVPQTADHWLITPSFVVPQMTSWFFWNAASEDTSGKFFCDYELYIAEDADTPEAFKKSGTIIYKSEGGEKPLKESIEGEGDDRYYAYTLNPHKVDLSKYAGKRVRLAFRDISTDKFLLLVGKMRLAKENGVSFPQEHTAPLMDVVVQEGQISARLEQTTLSLYDMQGKLLISGHDELHYATSSGIYILRAESSDGISEVRKVLVP